MNLIQLERELKKRTRYQYHWGRKQNDIWDSFTNYIYKIKSFDEFLEKTEKTLKHIQNAVALRRDLPRQVPTKDRQDFFNYAANRWYNFNSASAVEKIICSVDGIVPALNEKDRLVDFTINGIKFDHKTSVFPEGFGNDIEYAQKNRKELIEWLYANQSQQQRKHLENRLFIVVYNSNGKHWKLKAELTWLQNIILEYANSFDEKNLVSLKLKDDGSETLSDIVWAVKP